MAEKRRVTNHNGRKGDKGKVITDKHNDRNFDTKNAENINQDKTKLNTVWKFQEIEGAKEMTQSEYEQAVYEEYFSEALDERNANYIRNRHRERVQTMEQFRKNERSCPEETIISVGNMSNPCPPSLMRGIFIEYAQWHMETFPNIMLLDAYLHLDEASPHIQQRHVWTAQSENGTLIISQEKALAEMGIEPPEPEKKVSRNNNAKMTYTAMCRAKLIEIAREWDIEIEDKPREKSKSGRKMEQYKAEQIAKDVEALKQQQAEIQADMTIRQIQQARHEEALEERAKALKESENAADEREKSLDKREATLDERETDLNAREAAADKRAAHLSEREADLNSRIKQYNSAVRRLTESKKALDSQKTAADQRAAALDEREMDLQKREKSLENRAALNVELNLAQQPLLRQMLQGQRDMQLMIAKMQEQGDYER